MKLMLCMRTDLNMRKGKMCAQAGHICTNLTKNWINRSYDSNHDVNLRDWYYKNNQKKICVGVDSLGHLEELEQKAKISGLITIKITDAGHTEFKKPTITCLGILGDDERLQDITGNLKLL